MDRKVIYRIIVEGYKILPYVRPVPDNTYTTGREK